MNRKQLVRRFSFAAAIGLALSLVSFGHAATFVLEWDPNTEEDLAGYMIYYGKASGAYTEGVDVGNVTTYTVSGLQDGVTYYFAATAYDTSDNESDFSNEVSGKKDGPGGTLGDCDASGKVSIAEVQSAINMFLGKSSVQSCADENGDNTVSISELQKIINNYLVV